MMPVPCQQTEAQLDCDSNMEEDDADAGNGEGNYEISNKRMRIEEYMKDRANSIYSSEVWNIQAELPKNVSDLSKTKNSNSSSRSTPYNKSFSSDKIYYETEEFHFIETLILPFSLVQFLSCFVM